MDLPAGLDTVPVSTGDWTIFQGSHFPTQFELDRTGFPWAREGTRAKELKLTKPRGSVLRYQASARRSLLSTLRTTDLLLNRHSVCDSLWTPLLLNLERSHIRLQWNLSTFSRYRLCLHMVKGDLADTALFLDFSCLPF